MRYNNLLCWLKVSNDAVTCIKLAETIGNYRSTIRFLEFWQPLYGKDTKYKINNYPRRNFST